MTRNIIKPVTRNGPTWSVRTFDSDAIVYIAAVEAADGAAMPTRVPEAINSLVVGCKADGTWAAIKAACFLKGPRTLAGALVPLLGPAPTNYNFVSGDYNPLTGLKGDGSTKRLGSNRNNNADPQDDKHLSVWIDELAGADIFIGTGVTLTGVSQLLFQSTTGFPFLPRVNRAGGSETSITAVSRGVGFTAASRANSTEITWRAVNAGGTHPQASGAPLAGEIVVFGRGTPDAPLDLTAARLAWYSIGEAINPALLDARLATYMTAINGATY